jgi:hypothetical protein
MSDRGEKVKTISQKGLGMKIRGKTTKKEGEDLRRVSPGVRHNHAPQSGLVGSDGGDKGKEERSISTRVDTCRLGGG